MVIFSLRTKICRAKIGSLIFAYFLNMSKVGQGDSSAVPHSVDGGSVKGGPGGGGGGGGGDQVTHAPGGPRSIHATAAPAADSIASHAILLAATAGVLSNHAAH